MHRYTLQKKVVTNEVTGCSRCGLPVVAADKLFFFQWCFTSTETIIWLIRDGVGGWGEAIECVCMCACVRACVRACVYV